MQHPTEQTESYPLFCKPPVHSDSFLFSINNKECSNEIAFRSFDLDRDLDTIYEWVHQPYAKRFWQLNACKDELRALYTEIQTNLQTHSFVGLSNQQLVCQIDLYNTVADELKDHTEHHPGNCGLHILMLPPRQLSKGLSECMLRTFVQFYFSFPAANCLYGEPDCRNTAANMLAKKAGFHFLKQVTLTNKTANLYEITKEQFQQVYSIL